MSGLVPLGIDVLRYINPAILLPYQRPATCMSHTYREKMIRSEIALQAISFGANIQTKVSRKVTHVVASTSRTRTAKVRQAAKYPHIKIVNQEWLLKSMSKWKMEDEEPYLVSSQTI